MTKNYYNTLGIKKTASEAEIKKAFRSLAMKWHPDKHKGDKKSEEKFKEINEAYQILGDKEKRKQYDTFGTEDGFASHQSNSGGQGGYYQSQEGFGQGDIFSSFGKKRGGKNQQVEFDLGDIFSSFGGGFGSSNHRDPQPQETTIIYELPLWDLLLGGKLPFTTPTGENLKLTIPENTKSGTKFRVAGKGKPHGGRRSDLYIEVRAKMPKTLSPKAKKLIEELRKEFL